jgi:hypothetical protein
MYTVLTGVFLSVSDYNELFNSAHEIDGTHFQVRAVPFYQEYIWAIHTLDWYTAHRSVGGDNSFGEG